MVQYGRISNIKFHKFSGDDVNGLIFRCRQFFKIDNVLEEMKVELATMHVYDRALTWHQQVDKRYGERCTWELYEQEALSRFGVVFEDPMVELKNLKQTSNVKSYQDKFESLLNKVDFSKSYAVSLFVEGLKDKISMPIRMFKLTTLVDAFSMTRMQEATNSAMKPRIIGESKADEEVVIDQLVESNKEENVEMCNDVFDNSCQDTPRISLNALFGVNSFQTMRVRGMVGKQPLHILVDSDYSCDAMLLPLGGYEMVLGVQWLATLGDIKWNFRNLTMEFDLFGKSILLRGTKQTTLQWMQGKNVQTRSKNKEAKLYSLMLGVYPASCHRMEVNKEIPETIAAVLEEFENVHHSSQKDAIEVMVNELMDLRVIRASQSSFSSAIVIVKKKDETWRMCVDYRQLNKKFVLVFFDDILVYNKLVEEHCSHLQQVLQVMNANKLSAKQKVAFDKLKEAMMEAPVLALPNFDQEFVIEIDASGTGIGAVSCQNGHHIAYLRKTLAAKHQDRHFKIRTDHFSLKYLLNQKLTTPFQLKRLPKLLGYDYEIVYKKGVDNGVVDAFSRVNQGDELLKIVATSVVSDVMDKVKASWEIDDTIQQLLNSLKDHSYNGDKLTLKGIS
nr:hypothetical protein [Tanacetum cinerariifolium]